MEVATHAIVSTLPISEQMMAEVRKETDLDVMMIELRRYIADGWPETRRQCPEILQQYWNHRDELPYTRDVTVKGERVVIPESKFYSAFTTLISASIKQRNAPGRSSSGLASTKPSTNSSAVILPAQP